MIISLSLISYSIDDDDQLVGGDEVLGDVKADVELAAEGWALTGDRDELDEIGIGKDDAVSILRGTFWRVLFSLNPFL